MSLETNLAAARAAVAHVKGLGLKAGNKIADRIAAAGGIEKVIERTRQDSWDGGPAGQGTVAVRKTVRQVMPKGVQPYHISSLRSRAAHYASKGYGNCQEQAEIALVHIYDQGVRPIDIVAFGAQSYDHVWVVVGLHPGAQSDNVRSWGKEAVWCDPWQGDGMAFSIDDLVKGKVRNLNALYKCDSVERIEAGEPMSLAGFG